MYGGHFCGMSERIDVPADSRSSGGSKVLLHESQPNGHLVDDGVVVRGCLIVHTPSSINELQLMGLCHQFTDLHQELCKHKL